MLNHVILDLASAVGLHSVKLLKVEDRFVLIVRHQVMISALLPALQPGYLWADGEGLAENHALIYLIEASHRHDHTTESFDIRL